MGKPLKVLMVEDSERDSALLKLYLRRAGYDAELHRVETQGDLATQLQARAWDVVISDFNLPGFNAFDAMKMVQESGREIPFVVLSGEENPGVIEEISAAGSHYISKSEMSEIANVIEISMQGRS